MTKSLTPFSDAAKIAHNDMVADLLKQGVDKSDPVLFRLMSRLSMAIVGAVSDEMDAISNDDDETEKRADLASAFAKAMANFYIGGIFTITQNPNEETMMTAVHNFAEQCFSSARQVVAAISGDSEASAIIVKFDGVEHKPGNA